MPAPDPIHFLQIEPTTRCNFTCGFCAGRHLPQTDLAFERFVAALDAFPELRHIELQGEGESLLHPRFFDMIALAQARGLKVSLITNGSLLTAEAIDRLLAARVEKLSISIESADPATFQELRGGKLAKVLRGVADLLAARDARGLPRPVVGLSITVLRRTRDELPQILALYQRLGLDGGVTLQPLQAMDAYVQHYDDAMRAQALDPRDAEAVWARFFSDAKVREIQRGRRAVAGFFEEMMADWAPAQRRCPWLERGLYLHNGGAVTACCMIKDTQRHALGRLEDGSAALLAGRAALRGALARGEVPPPCHGCELARFAVMRKPALVGFALRGLWSRLFGEPRRTVRLPIAGQP